MSVSLIEIEGLGVTQGGRALLDDATLALHAGECVGLIGPNGAGKTTLLRAALGLIPHRGASSLARMTAAMRARHAAFLPQTRGVAWPVSVADLVALGLLAHRERGQVMPGDAAARVAMVLAETGLTALAGRAATSLSGGELARVLLARVLVQDTPLIVADEPAAGLDPAQQISLMVRLRSLADAGKGVLVSLHDLGLAARHCTRLVLMAQGRIVADGVPMEVLNARNLETVFGLRARVVETGDGPILVPVALAPVQ